MVSAIVAVDSNWGIGKDNKLLFHIREDLKRFKELTINKTVLMGRKTWDSLPKKPLPNRLNVVMTKNHLLCKENTQNPIYVTDEILERLEIIDCNETIFVIGGEQIYKKYLPMCTKVYVTKILDTKEADSYFPNLDKSVEWECDYVSDIKEEDGVKYKFCTYSRKPIDK